AYVLTDSATAAAEAPAPVLARRVSEIWPVASSSYLAWAESSRRRPNRFRAFVKPAGGDAFRVNRKGRSGFPGGIDGSRLVFTETGKSWNLRLVDLATRERLRLPAHVNTKADEWGATLSGRWLLFGRVEPAPSRGVLLSKVLLFDLETGDGKELAASASRRLEPGQVSGDWTLWHSCSETNCRTIRYRISDGSRERISLAQPSYGGSIAADGTAYYAVSRPKCGKEVAFYEHPVDGPSRLLFTLPDGVDVLSTYAYDDGGATKLVFARVPCRTLRGDVYSFDPAGAGAPPDVGPEIATGRGSVTYQVDTAHSGQLGDSILTPPLRKLWSTELGEGISYPLVADGKVFVTVGASSDDAPTAVYALDASTGTIAWFRDFGERPHWTGAAYDDGKVFVLTNGGILLALDADEGRQLWEVRLEGQYSFSSQPTADAGMVYTAGAGTGGTFYAVRQENGSVAWTREVWNGDNSSPALSGDSVFVSYVGPQVYAFDRTSGAERWHYAGCCQGGGGSTPVYHDGHLYVRDNVGNHVLDAATGERVGGFDSDYAPAFSGERGFFLHNAMLVARGAPLGSVEWTFRGDGYLASPPVVANGHVYLGSGLGNVYALDRGSGEVAWSGKVTGAVMPPDEHNAARGVAGLGLGRGILLVPSSRHLTAFVSS
nr:PQQ-binding-like beta-propeller repeat protein [Actinomycetota bacterium]